MLNLKTERANLVNQARQLNEQYNGRLPSDQQEQFDRIMGQVEDLGRQIENNEKIKGFSTPASRVSKRVIPPSFPKANRKPKGKAKPFVFKHRGEQIELQPGTKAYRRHTKKWREGFRGWLSGGKFAANLQTDIDTKGGYLTVPEEFIARLIEKVDDINYIRGLATTFTTTAQSIGVPERTTDLDTWNWSSELTVSTEDTSLAFGKRALTPHYLSGKARISRDLLRSAVMSVESIVMDRMAYNKAYVEEQAFLLGNGQQKPLGLFVANDDGITTSRDVSTGNTTTDIGADHLRNVKYTLKPQYWANARWLLSREAVKRISLLKDGESQYLWQPGIALGDPDTILGFPVVMSEYVPAVYTTGNYVGMFGDFSHYWIVDSLSMEMQRLEELYAEQNRVGFIQRAKVDGAPTMEEAFVRMQLA